MYRNFRRASIIALALAVFVFGIALAAFDVAEFDNGFKVTYLGHTGDQVNTTWTYSVTESDTKVHGLSHWTLGICNTFEVIAPIGFYQTNTSIVECTDGTFDCQTASYTVVTGLDPTTGVFGIKFEDPSPILDGGPEQYTHVFQFEVYHPDGYEEAVQDVGMKWGNDTQVLPILGPQCPPTAVSLASFGASTGQSPLNNGLIWMLAAGLLLLVGGGSYIIAQRKA
jgi:hypothetical protein